MAIKTFDSNTVLGAVEQIGGKSKYSLSDVKKQAEAEERIRYNAKKAYAKKFANDKEKLDKAAEDAVAKYRKKLDKKSTEENLAALKEQYKEAQSAQQKLVNLTKQAGEAGKIVAKNAALGAVKAVTGALSSLNSGINNYLSSYSQYMTGIETRIQGSTKSFASMTGMISRNIGASQYVSQSRVLENLNKLVSEGIVYNVEQRAFLASISDKIATTFDNFDSSLLRIIKIQQADSTAARLGLEAQLTQFLNKNFLDTSYLNNLSKTVSAALLGAESQLGRNQSIAFEYNVQKWLGSLSAVGVSESTIQSLAQGLGYLGTGDIASLAGNTQLQNLLVMASQRAGLDYSRMLTGGLTAEDANQLLRSIVKFGQEIASTNNQVVKSQYAQLFGMTISDLTALMNISSQDMITISQNMLTYSSAVAETTRQITKIPDRMTLSDRIKNMFDNVMAGVGESIANNAAAYTTWLVTDLIEQATGGINIPTIGALGNFVDLNATATGLLKLGIVGVNVLGKLGTILSGLTGANTLTNWETAWGGQEVLKKGWGFTGINRTGLTTTTSQTMYVGSSSGSDIYQQSVLGAQEEAKQTFAGTSEGENEQIVKSIEKAENIIAMRRDLDEIYDILTQWRNDRYKVTISEF